ncbi:GAF domain-containing protein [Mycobacterium sp. NPDC049093]
MSYTLDPILRRIANRAVDDPHSLRSEIPVMVANAAAELLGPEMKTRSCFFVWDAGPPRRLVLEEYAGRPDPVRTMEFNETQDRGADAIALVEQAGHLLCENVDTDPPPHWNADGDYSYKTFISVGVRTRASEWGMLTVDAPAPKDLNQLDVDLLRVMGGLIAAAMSIAHQAGTVGGQQ